MRIPPFLDNFDIMAQKEQDDRKWKVAVFGDSWQNNKELPFLTKVRRPYSLLLNSFSFGYSSVFEPKLISKVLSHFGIICPMVSFKRH